MKNEESTGAELPGMVIYDETKEQGSESWGCFHVRVVVVALADPHSGVVLGGTSGKPRVLFANRLVVDAPLEILDSMRGDVEPRLDPRVRFSSNSSPCVAGCVDQWAIDSSADRSSTAVRSAQKLLEDAFLAIGTKIAAGCPKSGQSGPLGRAMRMIDQFRRACLDEGIAVDEADAFLARCNECYGRLGFNPDEEQARQVYAELLKEAVPVEANLRRKLGDD